MQRSDSVWGDPGCGYTAAEERSDPPAIGAGSNRSGSPYCPDPQQWPHGLASGHRVQPAQPDRNADRPLEGCHRPQAQIPQLLQADHGDPTRPKSPEHNDPTRTACVRTHRLTLSLGKGRIPSPPRSMQQRCFSLPQPTLGSSVRAADRISLAFPLLERKNCHILTRSLAGKGLLLSIRGRFNHRLEGLK